MDTRAFAERAVTDTRILRWVAGIAIIAALLGLGSIFIG
jgi:hypothetical protein